MGFGITELEDEKSQLVTYYYYVTVGKWLIVLSQSFLSHKVV